MALLRYSVFICASLLAIGAAPPEDKDEFCQKPDWFLCGNGRCLSTFFVCDGEDDCTDGTDEVDCTDKPVVEHVNTECPADEFKCQDNICIPLDAFCDRQYDCPDRSDEYEGCTNNKTCNEFRCKNGYCMKNSWLCDGVDDCGDSSDEINCGNRTIPAEQCNNQIDRFLCNNGRCMALNKTCDGKDDCGDGSDEDHSKCKIAEEACKKGSRCSHTCNKTPRGPSCSCPSGHRLISNQTCKDINECAENPELCDQRCVNVAGSYRCICEVGYELQDDKKTCKVQGGEALMVFSSKTEIRGFYLESEIYFPIAQNLQHVVGVSVDANYIYWSSVKFGNEAIFRSREDGTKPELIVTAGLGLPEEIAVDWITGNVYFTDSVYKHVAVCNNDGTICTVVIRESVDMPRGLALHPARGEMFWSDFGAKPHISVAAMDGKNRRALVTDNVRWPNGLAIDYPTGRLYWVDAKLETVESVRLDGTDRRRVLKTTATHPYSIAIFENKLYWSDWETRSIQSADKYSGKNRSTLLREFDIIYGIHIYHSVLKPKIPNPCNTQPCSHLCLLAANRTYSCACPLDKEIGNDRHSCRLLKKHEHLLIAAGKSFVDYYHEMIGRPKITGIQTHRQITHIAYDSITDTIIASDQLTNSIFRYDPANYKISEIMIVKDEFIGGLDFDHYGNNIYWSDIQRKAIEIHSLESGHKTVLHFAEEPRDILLIPEHGVMFVVFRSKEIYHMDKLHMNSAEPREHIVEDLQGPRVSLAYDKDTERIFWADEGTGRIECVSIRGEDRRTLHSGVDGPVSIAILDRHVFWTLGKSRKLQWADKLGKIPGVKSASIQFKEDEGSMDLETVSGVFAGTKHKCRVNNGGCSHVCLVAVTPHHVCACPAGMKLDQDKRTCSMQNECKDDEIRCNGSNACISKMRRCNGITDCPNGEDEDKCDVIKTCLIGEFACRNGQCIKAKDRCNSYFDCADQSDEANCDKDSCKHDEFQCTDGTCISKFLVCDGRIDCPDYSDETNCGRHVCDDTSFRCSSGTCIPKSWECDGQIDCEDSSDEDATKCRICPEHMFQCDNRKRCLGRGLVCDQGDDCGDGSDEKNCDAVAATGAGECTVNEYKCHGTEKCISLKLKCNGEQDCPKNDDEHRCTQCQTGEFACENKKCIPLSWRCDQTDDCGDTSDEKNCDARGNYTTAEAKSDVCEQFRCTIGACLPYEKVCDGKRDCFDGTDEDGKCSGSCANINPCEQLCQKTPAGPLCLCREGFTLDNDGKSCRDIDECEQGICTQLCVNKPGSFECKCHENYVLRSNRISCKVAGEPMEIITAKKSDIRKISATLRSIEVIRRLPGGDVTGLDVNMLEETLYWSNELLGTLNRLNMRTNEFKFVSGLGRPGILAVDWVTDNVYFHDGEKPSIIKVCSMEKQKCANVVRIEGWAKPMAIAVDPKNGWLFWSQTTFAVFEGPTSEIYRTDMSGSNQVNVVQKNLGVVSGITIDHMRSRLYWADALLNVIERSDLDGNNREIYLKHQVYIPLGINIFEDSIYWLKGTSMGILKKCGLHGDKTCEEIDVQSSSIDRLFVISQTSRQPSTKNHCEHQDCEYMCVLGKDTSVCICPNGLPSEANATCGKEVDGTSSLKFESTTLGLKKIGTRQEGGLFTGIVITVAVGIAVLSAYYYYQKKKFEIRNKHDLSIHFQNPSFGRSVSGPMSDFVVPVLPTGGHEYTNPMTNVHANKSNSSGRRTLELMSSDHSDNELDDGPNTHHARLIG